MNKTKTLRKFNASLIGLFGTVVFRQEVQASDKYHAIKIAAAIYNDCYTKGDAVEILPEAVIS